MDKKKQSLKAIITEAYQNFEKKNFKATEILCNKILNIDPNHFEANYLLGSSLAQNRNFDLAKKLLTKAIQIDPNHLLTLNNLGMVFHELGEFQLAIDQYERAIKIKKKYCSYL